MKRRGHFSAAPLRLELGQKYNFIIGSYAMFTSKNRTDVPAPGSGILSG